MATVIESKGKTGTTYRVRTRDERGRQTTETFRARKDAESFARQVELIGGPAAIRLRTEREGAGVVYVPTLGEWLPKHTEQLTGVTERTRVDYHSRARLYWQDLTPLDAITREHVAGLVNGLERQGLAAGTIKTIVRALSAVLNSAILAGHIDRNPCKGTRLPRAREAESGQAERFLTPAEYRRLIAAIPERDRPLAALLFGSGLRWGEATALTVGDVTLGALSTVRVSKAWKSTPGKAPVIGAPKSRKSRRIALLSDDAAELVAPLLDREPGALLFTAKRGGVVWPGTWRERVWVPACIAAGLASPRVEGEKYAYDGPRIHDARHSHASWLISNGATLEMVQDQLGHESILTTRQVYGHLLPETRNRLAEALRSAMSPTVTGPKAIAGPSA
ncbi:tyrosine-type recombinase/integrase [Flexivirga sp.]|uniref:tyrosine-type recombinase/integrase n=1 Tax=Flexivirga sp. TaxID=1962927 RepID=UPI003F7FE8E9